MSNPFTNHVRVRYLVGFWFQKKKIHKLDVPLEARLARDITAKKNTFKNNSLIISENIYLLNTYNKTSVMIDLNSVGQEDDEANVTKVQWVQMS